MREFKVILITFLIMGMIASPFIFVPEEYIYISGKDSEFNPYYLIFGYCSIVIIGILAMCMIWISVRACFDRNL